ncbi:hypothetical protein C7B69_12190 [filamentous cyanobacterium Phorm 46]|nr:hypothetical protein C7B69_12190 [filamentous cyanobacterium Phorm 46]
MKEWLLPKFRLLSSLVPQKNLRIFPPQTSASYIFLDKIAERVPKPRFLTLNQSQRMMSSLEQKITM